MDVDLIRQRGDAMTIDVSDKIQSGYNFVWIDNNPVGGGRSKAGDEYIVDVGIYAEGIPRCT